MCIHFFRKKAVERIVRIGLLVIMVVVGLTAIAPQWLDLKDTMVAEHLKNKPQISQHSQQKHKPVTTYLYGKKIIEAIVILPKPDLIGGPPLGIFVLLWYLFAGFMFVVFFGLFLLLYISLNWGINKYPILSHLNKNNKVLFFIIKSLCALIVTWLYWYYIVPLFFA